jgi:hypothetical protein
VIPRGTTTVPQNRGTQRQSPAVDNGVADHFGETWSCDDDSGSGSVADLCAALTPMMPPLFDDRSDIAAELLRAHHQVVSLLAGPICEELFTGERLPGSEHDDIEAAEIGRLICRSASSLPAYVPTPAPRRVGCFSTTPTPSIASPTRFLSAARCSAPRSITSSREPDLSREPAERGFGRPLYFSPGSFQRRRGPKTGRAALWFFVCVVLSDPRTGTIGTCARTQP